MEYIILILIGLFLDICGVILILKPLLNRMKKIDPSKNQGAKISDYSIRHDDEDIEYRHQTNARFGLMFLLVGFFLQIIGNYLQYFTLTI